MTKTFVINCFLDTEDGIHVWCGHNNEIPIAAEGETYDEMVGHVWEQARDLAVDNGRVEHEDDIHLVFISSMPAPDTYVIAAE